MTEETRQSVFELRKLDLKLTFARLGARSKYIEYKGCSVDNAYANGVFDVF